MNTLGELRFQLSIEGHWGNIENPRESHYLDIFKSVFVTGCSR